ncbi:glycosyltransferase family 2 protein [Butyrivibrio sp.]|uniref:glycosyltransferase family 2 protein n=1 Tax=Butyrivibrio sp. TaxID=28121 RepID=UPI0025C6A969|nr:glycosyltransferase family 2 protein [Butyrivibrio sp.]MBE5837096.1 glycosyltransferase family 2 protein [Butyrivibrio sp.]
MKKVSVIVPAYNAHDTLARCLGSLVNQTLQEIEVIVVNDCSKDDTWEIMKRCKKQFPDKVEIINSEVNRGPGGARNQALEVATGEYIGLVDSDDYVVPNMYELLYSKAAEGNYDMVDCGFYREATDEARLYTGDNDTGELNATKRNSLIVAGGYLVTRLIRRELWNDPRIRMRENILCLEDSEILTYMLMRAKSIGNVKEILYKYCDTFDSATKTIDFETYYNSIYGAMSAIYNVTSVMDNYEECRQAIEYEIVQLYSYGVNRCLMRNIRKYGASIDCLDKFFTRLDKGEKKNSID